MSVLLKKIILSCLASLVLFFSVAPNYLYAQDASTTTTAPWYNTGPLDFYLKVFDGTNSDIFGERYTYAQVTWISYSLLAVIASFAGNSIDIPATIRDIQANSQQTMNTFMRPGGKLAQTQDPMIGLISQFYKSPPASGMYWLTQKINDFSIIKKAYAAPTNGFGYSSLEIFQPLWSLSRNIAYSLMVIVFLAVAFAVMFRLKISPQLVVTIQSALPKIASTLILITFSYAIVGFLIDLMYLIFGALVYAVGNTGGLVPLDLFNNFLNGSIFTQIGTGAGISIGVAALALIGLASASAGTLIPFVVGLLIAVVMFFVKVFLMLAQTYLSLVINLVFGPIIIISEAIPFIKASAIGWFKSVVADILVFMVVGLIFLAQTLINNALDGTGATWSPPFLSFDPTIFKIMIWVGVWSMLPNVRPTIYKMMERTAAEIGLPREFQGTGENLYKGIQAWKGLPGKGGKTSPN